MGVYHFVLGRGAALFGSRDVIAAGCRQWGFLDMISTYLIKELVHSKQLKITISYKMKVDSIVRPGKKLPVFKFYEKVWNVYLTALQT